MTAITGGAASTRVLRWQIAPATLSVALGVILFLMNYIQMRDAMIPEIQRAFDPAHPSTVAHGLLCCTASSLVFGASACALVAARYWMTGRYGMATAIEMLGIPSLISAAFFLMYFPI